jgi:hypothetical protein
MMPGWQLRARARLGAVTALAGVLCLSATTWAATDAQKCERAMLVAAAKYSSCMFRLRAVAATAGTTAEYTKCEDAFGKKLVAAGQKYGPACPKNIWTGRSQRFIDQGDGTVHDEATGLQWEKKRNLDEKPNPDDPHDADNVYTWTTKPRGTAEDGTAFTTFLAALNAGECFAKHCDWRLPSLPELRTILMSPMPCSLNPCLDPIFGPTAPSIYWSGSESAYHTVRAWYVFFISGYVTTAAKVSPHHVRAVRGGR